MDVEITGTNKDNENEIISLDIDDLIRQVGISYILDNIDVKDIVRNIDKSDVIEELGNSIIVDKTQFNLKEIKEIIANSHEAQTDIAGLLDADACAAAHGIGLLDHIGILEAITYYGILEVLESALDRIPSLTGDRECYEFILNKIDRETINGYLAKFYNRSIHFINLIFK